MSESTQPEARPRIPGRLSASERAAYAFNVLQFTESLRSKGSNPTIPPGAADAHTAAVETIKVILAEEPSDTPNFPTPLAAPAPPAMPTIPRQ